jgi:hypothetical protein
LLVVAVTEFALRILRPARSEGTEIWGFNQPGAGVNRYFLDSMRVNVAEALSHLENVARPATPLALNCWHRRGNRLPPTAHNTDCA